MKILGHDVTSPGDVATVLIGVPAAYFGWVQWGDPTLVDPQIAAPLIGAAALGVKKVLNVTHQWHSFQRYLARRQVEGLLRHARRFCADELADAAAHLRDTADRINDHMETGRRPPAVSGLVHESIDRVQMLLPAARQECYGASRTVDEAEAAAVEEFSSAEVRAAQSRAVDALNRLADRVEDSPMVKVTPALQRLLSASELLDAKQIRSELDRIKQTAILPQPAIVVTARGLQLAVLTGQVG